MVKLFRVEDTIGGEQVAYEFGKVPTSAPHRAGLFSGHMDHTGTAVVDAPLFSEFGPRPEWAPPPERLCREALDRILCMKAKFSCQSKPKLPGARVMKSGKHKGWSGTLRDQVLFQIVKPLSSLPQ